MGFRVPSGGGKSGGKGGFRIPTTRPDAPSSKFKPFKNISIPKINAVRSVIINKITKTTEQTVTPTPSGNWILASGFWNDSGIWDDSAIWID